MLLKPLLMIALHPGRRPFAVTSATRYIAWLPCGNVTPQRVPGSGLACATKCGRSLETCRATHVESVCGARCLEQTKFDYMNQMVNAESAYKNLTWQKIAANKT